MTRVRVVTEGDGIRAQKIRIFIDGVEITNATGIRIHPITGGDRVVRISVDLINVELDVSGELVDATVMNDDVTKWAVGYIEHKAAGHG